jgi:hypothetical protein
LVDAAGVLVVGVKAVPQIPEVGDQRSEIGLQAESTLLFYALY